MVLVEKLYLSRLCHRIDLRRRKKRNAEKGAGKKRTASECTLDDNEIETFIVTDNTLKNQHCASLQYYIALRVDHHFAIAVDFYNLGRSGLEFGRHPAIRCLPWPSSRYHLDAFRNRAHAEKQGRF